MGYGLGRLARARTILAVTLWASCCAGVAHGEEATGESRLERDRGWNPGSIQEQLDDDPTLVPFGKGALFIPSMTYGLDEPPIAVFFNGRRIEEGTTGKRIILHPGTYDVRVGSGGQEERITVQATVREGHTTVVPVTWAGLVVHVIDEQYGSVRTSYELIRVEDREYIGLGFGTDELAGEPISTWILRPGLYKIVRVGETYRARRDFATVRLLPGRLTHFLLVVDEDTGEFAGGGEVPEDELFTPRDGFFGSLILGGDVAVNSRNNVPGLPDGLSFTARAFLDARLSVEIAENPLILLLQVEEGQTKLPDLPFQKSNDRVDLDALYVYRLQPWIGPYARLGAETNLFNSHQVFPPEDGPVDIQVTDLSGVVERRDDVTELRLSPPFGLSVIKEGAGLNVRVFKALFGEMTVRGGIGARHRIARDLFELVDDVETDGVLEYGEIGSTHQVGVEATVLAIGRLSRYALINLELDTLIPFEGVGQMVLDLEASVSLKLTSYASINYVLRFRRDPGLTQRDSLDQDIRLRFSVEIF